jgi:hypothetical protein
MEPPLLRSPPGVERHLEEERRLRSELSRASHQVYRAELYASALTSAAAARWHVLPRPDADTEDAQQQSARRQLRVLAVMCTCHRPFAAWSRLCAQQRARRLALATSGAAGGARLSRLHGNMVIEMRARLNKQYATLSALGERAWLRKALRHWSCAAYECSLRRVARRAHSIAIWQRWRRVTALLQQYGPMPVRRVRLKQCAEAVAAFAVHATRARWLRGRWASRDLACALRTLRSRTREGRPVVRLAVLGGRVRLAARLSWAMVRWSVRARQRARRDCVEHQDAAIRCLLRLWASTAQDALRALTAFPPLADSQMTAALLALGGAWTGGEPALATVVAETAKHKRMLADARGEVAEASARADGAAARVDGLMSMIDQQRANLAAMEGAVARAEAELVCLGRGLHAHTEMGEAEADEAEGRCASTPLARQSSNTTPARARSPWHFEAPFVTAEEVDAPFVTVSDVVAAHHAVDVRRIPERALRGQLVGITDLLSSANDGLRERMLAAEARCQQLEGQLDRMLLLVRRTQAKLERGGHRVPARALAPKPPRRHPPGSDAWHAQRISLLMSGGTPHSLDSAV